MTNDVKSTTVESDDAKSLTFEKKANYNAPTLIPLDVNLVTEFFASTGNDGNGSSTHS